MQRELPWKSCYCSPLGSIWAGSAASPPAHGPSTRHRRGPLRHGGFGGSTPGGQPLPHGLAMNPGERSGPFLCMPATERERSVSGSTTPSLVASFCTKHPQRAGGCCAVWQGGQRCQTPCAASGQPGCACSRSIFMLQLKTTAPAGMILEPGSPRPREPCSSRCGGLDQRFRRAFQE